MSSGGVPRAIVWLAVMLVLMHNAPLPGQDVAPGADVLPAVRTGHAADSTDAALEARTRAVASQLRCVVCLGLSVADSPSELAQEMKSVIREQLRAGRTPDQVKAYFVERYGEWVLLQPRAEGFNLVVYVLPFAVLLGGIALVAFTIRRWTRVAASSSSQPS